MKRRDFIKLGPPVIALLANGNIIKAAESLPDGWWKRKVILRFAIASDGHYGQPNTAYEDYFGTIVEKINSAHAGTPFQFTVINGDIIHDDKKFFPDAKAALDKLDMKYYVSQGNHDHIGQAEWENLWKMPVNFSFTSKSNSFIIGTTSDETGKYLCPDIKWFESELQKHRSQKNIFIFIHINPAKLTPNAVDCVEWSELLRKYPNVRAVFNGHDHDLDDVKVHDGINYVFDSHFGGSWGTAYKGFRVVELLNDNTVISYILNPSERIRESTFTAMQHQHG